MISEMETTPQAQPPADGQAQPQSVTLTSWMEYIESQPEEIKGLYSAHTESLTNAVKATRQERDALAKQIKELAKAQAEGSDARKALDEMSGKLERAERRAEFMENAPAAQCKNPKAAWLLAEAGNLFDAKGRPDWNAIKAEAPELFGTVAANANAGAGTQTPPPSGRNMNDYIRKAAGRG